MSRYVIRIESDEQGVWPNWAVRAFKIQGEGALQGGGNNGKSHRAQVSEDAGTVRRGESDRRFQAVCWMCET